MTPEQDTAKEAARAHLAALSAWAHHKDDSPEERHRLTTLLTWFQNERQAIKDKTGWAYQCGEPGIPGYWIHVDKHELTVETDELSMEPVTVTRIEDKEN